jgi:hypothetical protein
MRWRTAIESRNTSKPATLAVPLEAGMKHDRIRMVVDFPAPFGPRKPTMSPGATAKETSRIAVTGP